MDWKNCWNKARGIFRGKTIAAVTLEELDRERNRLQADQDKLHAEVDSIDARERQLLDEGRAAPNAAMQKRIAGKIKESRDRRKTLEQRLSLVAKSLRIATGLHTIKENETAYKSAGLAGALSGIPLAQIVAYIEKSPAGAERTVDGMQDILESLDEAGAALDGVFADPAADGELDDIMAEFANVPESDSALHPIAARPAAAGPGREASTAVPRKQEEK